MNEIHPEPRHKLTFKVLDALRTVHGYTLEEYKMARAEAFDDLKEDLELVQMAKAIGAAGAVVAAAPSAPAPAAPSVPSFAPPSSYSDTSSPTCNHGPRTARSGTSQYGPWKAWMCPTPKGTPDQCQPIYLNGPGRKGHNPAEWSSFPA